MEPPPLRPNSIQPAQSVGAGAQERQAGGRVFSAEVVQTGAGGSLVLAVGRDRIAATSLAALQVGQRLLLRMRGSGASQVLELLTQTGLEGEVAPIAAPLGEPPVHPFALLAQGKGLGELLADLSQHLGAPAQTGKAPTHGLARTLEAFAFAPGGSGAQLAQHLSSSPLAHEARSLAGALAQLPAPVLATAAQDLVKAAFAQSGDASAAANAREGIADQLARLLANPAALAQLSSPAGAAPSAFTVLTDWLAPALARGQDSALAASARAGIVELLAVARLSPHLAHAVLAALLGERAPLLAVLAPTSAPQTVATLPDLKAWLLELSDTLESGSQRTAVHAALESLEAEQLLSVARSNIGEGSTVVFALRDGAAFADAQLVHRRSSEREAQDGKDNRGSIERATLGLEFSRTGPVRAELALDAGALRVRLFVSNEQVAAQCNTALDDLRARLEALGRSVQLQVGVLPREELRVPGAFADAALSDGRSAVNVVA